MQADELADEITVARECIHTARDLRLRKQMAVYGRVAFLKRPRVRYAHKKARWQAG